MTEMLKKEFSRKTFVKGGGALIVGFSLAGAGLAGKAQAADSPFASNGPFDQYQIDSWIAINADNTASIKSGGILQGTGSDDRPADDRGRRAGHGDEPARCSSAPTRM